MPTMRIVLQVNEQEALQELAKRELRDPRAQAAFIIRHKLEEIGLLPVEESTAVGWLSIGAEVSHDDEFSSES